MGTRSSDRVQDRLDRRARERVCVCVYAERDRFAFAHGVVSVCALSVCSMCMLRYVVPRIAARSHTLVLNMLRVCMCLCVRTRAWMFVCKRKRARSMCGNYTELR